jgi:hypothetical protein
VANNRSDGVVPASKCRGGFGDAGPAGGEKCSVSGNVTL